MDMSDLFVRLLNSTRLIEAQEDVFTECFAATLKEDEQLTRQFMELVCGGKEVDGVNIETCAMSIETQKSYRGSCVDMIFSLRQNRSTLMIGLAAC
jgi:hypothetical protein